MEGGVAGGVPTPAPPPVDKPKNIPMNAIENQMISGEKDIKLPVETKSLMVKQGIRTPLIIVKVGVNTSGAASSVDVAKGSGFREGDQNIVAHVREWKFKPYTVNGTPVPVCAIKQFRYQIE